MSVTNRIIKTVNKMGNSFTTAQVARRSKASERHTRRVLAGLIENYDLTWHPSSTSNRSVYTKV